MTWTSIAATSSTAFPLRRRARRSSRKSAPLLPARPANRNSSATATSNSCPGKSARSCSARQPLVRHLPRQRVDEHRAFADAAVQADEAHLIGRAGCLIRGLAVIDGGDELRADFVGELVFLDVGARDRKLLERRVFLPEL